MPEVRTGGLSPKMRRRARECAVQFLFGLDFTGYDWGASLDGFWESNPSRPGVKRYAKRLIRGVIEHSEEVDEAITGALEHWSPDRVARVEQNVLRVAVFEMLHCEDVPDSVAINEAIEVAKRFGADDAARFVNGVLDRAMKSLRSES